MPAIPTGWSPEVVIITLRFEFIGKTLCRGNSPGPPSAWKFVFFCNDRENRAPELNCFCSFFTSFTEIFILKLIDNWFWKRYKKALCFLGRYIKQFLLWQKLKSQVSNKNTMIFRDLLAHPNHVNCKYTSLSMIKTNLCPLSLSFLSLTRTVGEVWLSVCCRHEVPVTSQPITIVHMDEDVVVVNKPASIPVSGQQDCHCFVDISTNDL